MAAQLYSLPAAEIVGDFLSFLKNPSEGGAGGKCGFHFRAPVIKNSLKP